MYFKCNSFNFLSLSFEVTISPTLTPWFSNPMSFINTMKSSNPSRVPWGPPPGRLFTLEVFPLYLTIISLSLRNPITTFSSQPGTPMSLNLVTNTWWFCSDLRQVMRHCSTLVRDFVFLNFVVFRFSELYLLEYRFVNQITEPIGFLKHSALICSR